MPAKIFRAYNGASGSLAATSVMSTQSTSSSANLTRTMLQIAPSSTAPSIRVIGWGYAFAAPPAANVVMDLVDSGAIFASSLTAHVAAGIQRMNGPAAEQSSVQLGTALTGYCTTAAGTPSTEGTYTASTTRLLDSRFENGLSFYWRFELGREPEIPVGNCLRLRATPTSAAALALHCWIDWEE
ncbi:hypothetical protein ACFWPK_22505 [Nocardia sp. NPDC058519]|uniref:hypothetical protein n=1 Tax=Nocardia sp. NPDC058519 TaxID=3346535 RepID=UPI00365746AA